MPRVFASSSSSLLAAVALLLVASVSAAASAPATLPANCSTALPRDSCAFYLDCLEATFPCGADGYAVGYGDKYCRAFAANEAWFSPKGKRWISDVMFCLQTDLVPLLTATAAKKTCPEIRQQAFSSHPPCYLQAGVCTLPVSDWIALARVIGIKQLVADLQAVRQEVLVALGCPGKWLEALLNKLLAL
ncbi:hypothetical protein PINS_up019370 [Pythium insidiosum]|nr:hypothetical protein PINS_up019370 [Pythium insidiosum]